MVIQMKKSMIKMVIQMKTKSMIKMVIQMETKV